MLAEEPLLLFDPLELLNVKVLFELPEVPFVLLLPLVELEAFELFEELV
jgi:hypothetical protein